MPRVARVVLPGYPHHITHRGNYKQIVFEQPDDYIFYSNLVKKYFPKYGLDILCYVLMPNHVHFILIPEVKDALAKGLNVTQMIYAQYINEKHSTQGHLWSSRFYSCILDPAHLYRAVRYVERNPVRAKLVKKAWDWQWSSAKEHVFGEKGIVPLVEVAKFIDVDNWGKYLSQEDEEYNEKLRKHTRTGKPIGDKSFVEKLETIFGRRFSSELGRPKSKN